MFLQALRSKLLLKLTQVREDFASSLISFLSLLPQRLRHDPFKPLWYFGRKWRRFISQNCCAYILCSVAAERKVLSQHFVENYAKTPDIRPQINHHSARLLRRHVTHGAKHYTLIGMNEWLGRGFPVECIYFRQLSNPEVEQLDIIFAVQGVVLLQHHNVFRLD